MRSARGGLKGERVTRGQNLVLVNSPGTVNSGRRQWENVHLRTGRRTKGEVLQRLGSNEHIIVVSESDVNVANG